MNGKIRVLIVDDSALIREMLSAVLRRDLGLEVVGTASDPLIARQMIKNLNPDVLTLDVEMPRMDGLAFLEKIMTLRPMPVIMVSTLTEKGTDTTLRALELGAVDFVAKPKGDLEQSLKQLAGELIPKIKAASRAKIQANDQPTSRTPPTEVDHRASNTVIAIGASTGGVVALRTVLSNLPADGPPILITQHMPPQYTKSLAERLNQVCAITVVEAENGQRVLSGHAYLAPGGRHLELRKSQGCYSCRVYEGPLVSGHCPSVDTLFTSFADHVGSQAIGAILTGMGQDGAAGLLRMRQAGAVTYGQSKASCVVYGMPRVAKNLGAVGSELPLNQIASAILRTCALSNSQRQLAS